jgi:hypothetical protein
MFLFTGMEVLFPPNEEENDHHQDEVGELDEEGKEKQSISNRKSDFDSVMTANFAPIVSSDFVPSICEGLSELLKDSRTKTSFSIVTYHINYAYYPKNGPIIITQFF